MAVAAVFLAALAFHRPFDHDEFQYLHIGWYLRHGYVAYRDFFDHHHELFSWLLSLLLGIFGEKTSTIFLARWVALCWTGLALFLVYKITLSLSKSVFFSRLAALLPLATYWFPVKAIEIRPDMMQSAFVLLSVYFLFRYDRRGGWIDLDLAGLSVAVSFLVLQKSSYYMLALIAAVGLRTFVRDRKTWPRATMHLSVSLAMLPALSLLGYWLSGTLQDYLFFCWKLNVHWFNIFPPIYLFFQLLQLNLPFKILAVSALFYLLIEKATRTNFLLFIPFVLACVLLIMTVKIPYPHHFVLIVPLMAIAIGCAASHAERFVNVTVWRTVWIIGLLALVPYKQFAAVLRKRNVEQIRLVQYVLDKTSPQDVVYDGDINFNIFRKDPSFFWYDAGGTGDLMKYSRSYKGLESDADICSSIRRTKPRIISAFRWRMDRCDLASLYKPIQFGLYELREDAIEPRR
jgi:hypothetical protein